MTVIGIDPGSRRAGYGIVSFEKNIPSFIEGGILETHSIIRPDLFADLYGSLEGVINTHSPVCAGIETLYASKNKKTVIEVAQAQGIILLSLAQHKIPTTTFTPNQIKQSITGYGSASKTDVQKAVKDTLHIPDFSAVDDVFDALAIALVAGFFHSSKLSSY